MRRLLALGVAALVAAAGAAALIAADRGGGEAQAADERTETALATVERRDLVVRETIAGTLGYADARALAAAAAGTVTRLPAEGATVRRGGVLYELDGRAVRLLYGTQPLYRRLASGVEDGWDVRQLERNLIELGHDPDGAIELDRTFDWATDAAVRRWQEATGQAEDGAVDLGEAVFLPGARRVGVHGIEVGATVQPGAQLLQTSSTRPVVTVDLDAARRELVGAGRTVQVELPAGETVAGTVTSVGAVAEAAAPADGAQGESEPTVEVQIALRGAAGGLEGAPVDVRLEVERARGALAVPVEALLALAGGGYAVELERDGARSLVAVTTGTFADGWVELEGEVAAGDRVVVPA